MFRRHTSKSVAARLSALLACALTLSALPFSAHSSASASAGEGRGGQRRGESTQIPSVPPGQAYKLTTLVSDSPGLAPVQDPLLINPWGISATATSPFWFANNGSSTSSLYRGDVGGAPFFKQPGMPNITIPEPPPSITGTVANNGGTTDFVITSGSASARANFLFASLSGKIYGWSPNVPAAGSTVATQAASQPGHVYTGLAIGNNGSANFLYAADFANGKIDVFNSTFALQPAASFPFNDPTIPTSPASNTYHPFNVQNIGGSLYVTYAKVDPATGRTQNGAGFGYVRRFTPNGVRDLTFGIDNGPLDAPWGITIAPASFGVFGGALLVGNFSDEGNINAFNPTTGAFVGTLNDEAGEPISIDELWALSFGNGGSGGDPNTLYFTSGLGEENHGLVGKLNPTTATATSLIQFASDEVEIGEGDGSVQITVTRAGNVTAPATVNYATFDEDPLGQPTAGHANQKSDYEIAVGVLRFAAGETSKTFRIPLVDDRFFEGDEDFDIFLTNPTGAGVGLGDPHVMDVVIHDNDTAPPLPIITGRSATGANAAAIQSAVDTFRNDLGPLNANVGGSFANGRREINWDGVPDNFSEPNNLPANFFNVNSPRGVILAPASGGNLRVSMDDDNPADSDPDQLRFSDLNASYLTAFQAFSQQRIFGVQGGANTVDVTFFVPGTATPATVSGFGAVFTDVDSATSTKIQFFDPFGQLISEQAVQATSGSGSFSFAGSSFTNRRVSRVRVISGNAQLGDNDTGGADVVAMDDFIYGEPQALPAGTNPIDQTPFFVRQHYLDFLNREPDTAGFNAWVNTLNNCAPGNTSCDRIAVSANFFRSDEYQARGFYATRFYRAAFGRDPLFGEFMGDLSRLSGATPEESASLKTTFANEFTQRPEFRATLDALTNAQYVDRLIANTGVTFPTAQRDQWVADLNSATKTRAQVLREVVEASVFATNQATINRAFVLAEYFGYLRRDPDAAGFNAWLALLNANPNDFRTMVSGFLNSAEYRMRFGPA